MVKRWCIYYITVTLSINVSAVQQRDWHPIQHTLMHVLEEINCMPAVQNVLVVDYLSPIKYVIFQPKNEHFFQQLCYALSQHLPKFHTHVIASMARRMYRVYAGRKFQATSYFFTYKYASRFLPRCLKVDISNYPYFCYKSRKFEYRSVDGSQKISSCHVPIERFDYLFQKTNAVRLFNALNTCVAAQRYDYP